MEKLKRSDRLMIVNADGEVVYRGYTANFCYSKVNPAEPIKLFGIGVETYGKGKEPYNWKRIESLPEQIPKESFYKYQLGELETIIYTKVLLEKG